MCNDQNRAKDESSPHLFCISVFENSKQKLRDHSVDIIYEMLPFYYCIHHHDDDGNKRMKHHEVSTALDLSKTTVTDIHP